MVINLALAAWRDVAERLDGTRARQLGADELKWIQGDRDTLQGHGTAIGEMHRHGVGLVFGDRGRVFHGHQVLGTAHKYLARAGRRHVYRALGQIDFAIDHDSDRVHALNFALDDVGDLGLFAGENGVAVVSGA